MGPNDTGVFTWTPAALPLEAAWERGLRRASKRLLDLAVGSLLLAAAVPVLLVAAAAIRLTSRGPVFFVQPRIGHRCRRFSMYKLRTMVDGAEREEATLARPGKVFFKLDDDPRITPVGRVLRRLSIDELPQVFNVLRGDMSLVGPRPLLVSDLERFPEARQRVRFSMKPGLTGLWQVSGRSLLSDDDRVRLDEEYVERWSFGRDLAILVRTPAAVLSGRGAT
ncbi:MAG: sugar transferase [Thermoanaerobaculia bacterium]